METIDTTQSTCNACAFWKDTGADSGECRVNPPQAIAVNIDAQTRIETKFPVTAADDWCGEFEAK